MLRLYATLSRAWADIFNSRFHPKIGSNVLVTECALCREATTIVVMFYEPVLMAVPWDDLEMSLRYQKGSKVTYDFPG